MEKMYIALDSTKINKPELKKIRGAELFSSLPPYYVPKGITVNTTENSITIKFHYSIEFSEKIRDETTKNSISFSFGKVSNRIYELSIPKKMIQEAYMYSNRDSEIFIEIIENQIEKHKTKNIENTENSITATKSIFENYGTKIFNLSV